ncbi:hypothetical protein [Nitratidesulfovibrio sp. 1201_IL3209]|uniref:hypothetical protein n=1 Tax=Nitratidesulfovibrio sp. 1201_IL3209 TaxID=3084053 RepID=UPI002FDA3506
MHSEQTRVQARAPRHGAHTIRMRTHTIHMCTQPGATAGACPAPPAVLRRAAPLLAALLAGVALLLGQTHPALAHRVNIFAWVEGGAIRCESSFSSGNPARDAKVTATLAGSGTVMGTAVTDAKGRCALPVTPELRAARADLIIEVQAGEGHRNTWTMPAEEYLAAPVGMPTAPAQDDSKAVAPAPAAASPAGTAQPGGAVLDEAALRRIVAEAVAEQVAPLRHSLAAMQSGGPRMADVAGGIGYIVGLAGIALWARSRRR